MYLPCPRVQTADDMCEDGLKSRKMNIKQAASVDAIISLLNAQQAKKAVWDSEREDYRYEMGDLKKCRHSEEQTKRKTFA